MNNTFSIFQLKDREDIDRELLFTHYDTLCKMGREVERKNYNQIWQQSLTIEGSAEEILEELFYIFNMERPKEFKGHSLSVSDVIILNRDGHESYYYTDSIGFKRLSKF